MKQAQFMFETNPATLPRERDLIRAMKDEEMTRNLPGKVKLMGMRTVAATYGYLGADADTTLWKADAAIAEPLELLKWLHTD